jgi:hypothetical protein
MKKDNVVKRKGSLCERHARGGGNGGGDFPFFISINNIRKMGKSRKKKTPSRKNEKIKRKGGLKWWWPFTRKKANVPQPKDMNKYRKTFLTCRSKTAKGRFLRTFYRKSCAELLLDENTAKNLRKCLLHALILYFAKVFDFKETISHKGGFGLSSSPTTYPETPSPDPFNNPLYKDPFSVVPNDPVETPQKHSILPSKWYTINYPTEGSYNFDPKTISTISHTVLDNIFIQIAKEFLIETTQSGQTICEQDGAHYAKQAIESVLPNQKECKPTKGVIFLPAFDYVKEEVPIYRIIVRHLMLIYGSKDRIDISEIPAVVQLIQSFLNTKECQSTDMTCMYLELFSYLKIGESNLPLWVVKHPKTILSKAKKTVATGKLGSFLLSPKVNLGLLKNICWDVGICLSLNARYERIMKMFNYFQDFTFLENSPKIISQGENGIVRLLKYKRTEGGKDFYSYGVFKFPRQDQPADNLLYEYEVGTRGVNHFCRYLPIFTQTYGAYFKNPTLHWAISYSTQGIVTKDLFDTSRLKKITPTDPLYRQYFCMGYNNVSLVGQFYHEFQPLFSYAKYMRDAHQNGHTAPNDIAYILFQVYYSLHQCRSQFTHYDLHRENVGLVPLPNNTHIEYEYEYEPVLGGQSEVITFKSRYIVKLIDYGRSFFNYNNYNSDLLITEIRTNTTQCPANSHLGIGEIPWAHILPRINNQSSDLRLLNTIQVQELPHSPKSDKLLDNFPGLFSLLRRVNYSSEYGTPQRLDAFDANPNGIIYNINDAFFKLAQYINNNVDQVRNTNIKDYANSKSLGTLKVYPGLKRQMEFIFADRKNITDPIFENLVL